MSEVCSRCGGSVRVLPKALAVLAGQTLASIEDQETVDRILDHLRQKERETSPRLLLVAHCEGDAQRLAELTTPVALSVNGGELTEVTPEQIARRFSTLFKLLDYRQYDDLTPPRIEIAKGGDIGWAAVEVRARGVAVESGKVFDDQWAWVMLARKVDGVWRHAGNASNRKAR